MLSNLTSKCVWTVALAAVVLVTACSVHVNSSIRTASNETVKHDLKTVNGSIKVADGSIVEGVCKTVNGSVELGAGARADLLKTVNGSIKIKSDAMVEEDVETVNGRISAEEGSSVGGNIKTVNGGLELGDGVTVEGQVNLVNGTMKFQGAHVKGDATFRNGDVYLSGNTILEGNLVLEGKAKRNNNDDPIEIRLSDQAVIKGSVIVEDPDRKVVLYLSGDARVEGSTEHVSIQPTEL
jgi:DUF4097 and DUF4098 domain-containing protein YvlB